MQDKLIAAGVRNLREYGYPGCTAENILTDRIYNAFFTSMLNDTLGKYGEDVDAAVKPLLQKCEANRG